ncbi:hypothetical protein Alg130_10962 [Pyrenophora tritici-repentis]|nr:hypothetical protein Alg130_10962 [Pyrenophora tritici-repentis]KAI0604609.1 hypothetical protein TUN205_11143 [Pyrenophora tritici-repentis]
MSTTNNPHPHNIRKTLPNCHHTHPQNTIQRVSEPAYSHTPTSPYNLTALPSQEVAQHHWPPSVYQAAVQYDYHAPLTLRQRYCEVPESSASTGELWPANHSVSTPYRRLSAALPQMAGSQGVYDQNPYTTTEYMNTSLQHSPPDPNIFTETTEDRYGHVTLRPGSSQHSPLNPNPNIFTATTENQYNHIPPRPQSPGANRPQPQGDDVQQGLHCSQCHDTVFTGYCARRNYNRHMERHHKEAKSIRCDKPECAKTFGRKDALLVHLRRSHPELDVPPAKKRRNGNLA